MKKRTWIHLVSYLLASILLCASVPVRVFAEEGSSEVVVGEEEREVVESEVSPEGWAEDVPGLYMPTIEVLPESAFSEPSGVELGSAATKDQFNVLLQKGFRELHTEFTVVYTGSDWEQLLDDIQNDETGKYFYGMEYQQWLVKGLTYYYGGAVGNAFIRPVVDYHHTAAQEQELNGLVNEVLSKMISSKMTDLQKIDAVHDYIVLMSKYRSNTSGSAHSPYTLMKERGGVCQAYALLGYKMLEKLGFQVRVIPGSAGGDHAWLKVKLDGAWYNLDITFDDPVPDQAKTVRYKYDLISDAKISSDHTEDPKIPFPKATSMEYDARANRGPRTYTQAEIDALLNGGDGEEEFDEAAYFSKRGIEKFKAPIIEWVGRKSFTVKFNASLSGGSMNSMEVYVLKGSGLTPIFVQAKALKNHVYRLNAGKVLPAGTYYVVLQNLVGSGGQKLKKQVYQKFVIR